MLRFPLVDGKVNVVSGGKLSDMKRSPRRLAEYTCNQAIPRRMYAKRNFRGLQKYVQVMLQLQVIARHSR